MHGCVGRGAQGDASLHLRAYVSRWRVVVAYVCASYFSFLICTKLQHNNKNNEPRQLDIAERATAAPKVADEWLHGGERAGRLGGNLKLDTVANATEITKTPSNNNNNGNNNNGWR